METLKNVRIVHILFKADDGEYAIMKGYHEGKNISLVGALHPLNEGITVDIVGEWTHHPRYGTQFTVHTYMECIPTDLIGIENYLNSGLISGVGPVIARRIVEHFGHDTLNVLENNIDRLSEVKGLGPERINQVMSAWAEQQTLRGIVLFLSAYGLSMTYILRIYKMYGADAVEKIKENPYRLVDDIEGVSFQIADVLALNMGMSPTGYPRCRSGVLYYLSRIGLNGHCYSNYGDVLSGAGKLLAVPHNLLDRAIQHMEKSEDIIIEDNIRIYPKMYYDYEHQVAKDILRILKADRGEELEPLDELGVDIEYTPKQVDAIKAAISGEKFIVITGEPGTGKTTIVRSIVDTYRENLKRVLLASPTGRAAKVLSDATDFEASTIHRLLEYIPGMGFGFNSANQLDVDLLVIDEVSMIDLPLMRHLLRAVPDEATVVLVGDACQIPSVGAGNVLADIITSGVVPVYQLDQIFRQGDGSSIKLAAHQINQGIMPDISNPEGTDFFFLKNLDEAETARMVLKLRALTLPNKRGVDPINDIHVIAPMYKGEAGVTKLNEIMQKHLNPNMDFVKAGNTFFKKGDKVLQTRNDYDKDIYNGSVGLVTKISTADDSLEVDFGHHQTTHYDKLELGDIDLGYATTVHKAQGSEYPIVIIPLVHTHGDMWYRKLIYTAITRAKQMVVLIGSPNVLYTAITKEKDTVRNTRLWVRLQEARDH